MTDVVAMLLILLAGFDWIATSMLIRGARHVHEPALEERATAATIMTFGATAAAVASVIVLLDLEATDGVWLLLFTVGFVALSVPQLIWATAYWRGGFR